MVTVPTYQQDQQVRPIFRQGVDVQASPEAFGSAIGRGMQQLGQGLDNAGTALAQVRDLEDVARAKDADNAYSNWLREAQYGEGGFMTMEGRNAVDGRSKFEETAAEKRKEFGKGLTPGAAQHYQNASQARLQSTLQQSIVHTAEARKQWFNQTSTSRIETFANAALVSFDKPALVQKNLAAGVAEIRQQAQMDGLAGDALKLRESEFVSGVHKNIALRIAQSDPIAANDYVKKNEGQLTGAHRYDLTNALDDAVRQEEAARGVAGFIRSGRVVDQPGDMVKDVLDAGGGGPANGPGPTRSKLFLSSISSHPDRPGDTLNLDGAFADNLASFIQDAPPEVRRGLGIVSGYRSNERQKELFANSDKTGKTVAFPAGYTKPDGSVTKGSYHLHGQAVDLGWNGQLLKPGNAPPEVIGYIHKNASKYGLKFPMGYEPWHTEPMETRGGGGGVSVASGSNTVAPRSTMPSYEQQEAYLNSIKDPKTRNYARQQLNYSMEMRNKAFEQNQKAAKEELWKYTLQGTTPDQTPIELRQAAGPEAVTQAYNYLETVAKGEKPKTDEVLLRDITLYAAKDPEGFAKVDFNDYRNQLADEDFRKITTMQASALTEQRKKDQGGIDINAAFSQARTQLEAVGITTEGKKETERMAEAERIARFQNTLAAQMEAFTKDEKNGGRAPTQMDIQAMVNRMLLPIVMKEPGSLWGTNSVDLNNDGKPDFLFDAGGKLGDLGNGQSVELQIDYKTIPINERVDIEVTLERVLGRKPSPAEVETAYEKYLTERR